MLGLQFGLLNVHVWQRRPVYDSGSGRVRLWHAPRVGLGSQSRRRAARADEYRSARVALRTVWTTFRRDGPCDWQFVVCGCRRPSCISRRPRWLDVGDAFTSTCHQHIQVQGSSPPRPPAHKAFWAAEHQPDSALSTTPNLLFSFPQPLTSLAAHCPHDMIARTAREGWSQPSAWFLDSSLVNSLCCVVLRGTAVTWESPDKHPYIHLTYVSHHGYALS